MDRDDSSQPEPADSGPLGRGATPAPPPHHMVYLDPQADRPVSQYSPEGEIRMMGDFAAGLARSNNIPRPVIWGLVLIVLLPILVTIVAVFTTW